MKLNELKKSQTATIIDVNLPSEKVAHRLGDLGLKVGQKVKCLLNSPFGGVTSFELSHGVFAIEDDICQYVTIKKDQ